SQRGLRMLSHAFASLGTRRIIYCRYDMRDRHQEESVMRTIRTFLLCEAIIFFLAAFVRLGALHTGYVHQKAGTAESVIGTVLLLGWLATWVSPSATRSAGLWAQGFALLGTLVGVFTIIIGVGPRTTPDILFHIILLILLMTGLRTAYRMSAL